MSELLAKVESCIRTHRMLTAGQELWVGLSGGADSIALVEILLDLGYKPRAAHCNFHLRGAESDTDEAFVLDYCQQKQIEVDRIDFDTLGYAAEQSISIEMAARRLRYEYFERLMQDSGISVLAVAHHADDNAETLLLNFAAGTGIRGLSGMPYKRHDGIIRPLLDLPQSALLEYLAAKKQSYCIDSTNSDERYKRNFVRHQLLPRFAELNPSFLQAFARTMENLRGVEAIYRQELQRFSSLLESQSEIPLALIATVAAPFTLLYDLLQPYGFSRAQIRSVAESIHRQPGAVFHSSKGYRLTRSFDALVLDRASEVDASETYQILWTEPGSLLLPDGKKLSWAIEAFNPDMKLKVSANECLLDADKLPSDTLTLRRPQEGDRIYPYGMQGSKLLSKLFVDKRLSSFERERIWLLTSGENLVWALALATDRRYALGRKSKKLLRFMF